MRTRTRLLDDISAGVDVAIALAQGRQSSHRYEVVSVMTTDLLDEIDRLVDETEDRELLKVELKALVARVEREGEESVHAQA
jgi:hypothetical protein